VADRQLVLEAQGASGLDPDFCLVAAVRGQLILTPASAAFVERVAWDGDMAAGWRHTGTDGRLAGRTPGPIAAQPVGARWER
jgi:hypothetical protein